MSDNEMSMTNSSSSPSEDNLADEFMDFDNYQIIWDPAWDKMTKAELHNLIESLVEECNKHRKHNVSQGIEIIKLKKLVNSRAVEHKVDQDAWLRNRDVDRKIIDGMQDSLEDVNKDLNYALWLHAEQEEINCQSTALVVSLRKELAVLTERLAEREKFLNQRSSEIKDSLERQLKNKTDELKRIRDERDALAIKWDHARYDSTSQERVNWAKETLEALNKAQEEVRTLTEDQEQSDGVKIVNDNRIRREPPIGDPYGWRQTFNPNTYPNQF